mgnify:CR=1 FL=1
MVVEFAAEVIHIRAHASRKASCTTSLVRALCARRIHLLSIGIAARAAADSTAAPRPPSVPRSATLARPAACRPRWVAGSATSTAQRIVPFKAFDDAWFVGVCWVSAWLLPTPQGHFLIDTLHEPHAAELLDNIRKGGFDPQDIRYVLITHWTL